jgi:Rrf2 family protein
MIHQKASQNAIAAMSRLAQLYRDPDAVASSRDIAESRNLPVPIVAKILTVLSRGGLITGSPGPGGGYRLSRPPAEISLHDITELFERESETACPYGPGWCGTGEPCPLHNSMLAMQHMIDEYLRNTTLAVFETKGRAVRARKKNS